MSLIQQAKNEKRIILGESPTKTAIPVQVDASGYLILSPTASIGTVTVQGPVPSGGTSTQNPVIIGGVDPLTGLARTLPVIDVSGFFLVPNLISDLFLTIQTFGADGENIARVGSTDQTFANAKYLKTDTNGVVSIEGSVAHDAADAGNPASQGLNARTTLPAAVADGDRARAISDDVGRQITIPHAPRDLVTQNTTTISSAAETTILSAVSGTFLDVTMLILSNTAQTSVRVDIRDDTAGTVRMGIELAPKGGAVIPFNVPMAQTATNKNWTAQLSTATTDVRIFVQAILNK